MLLYYIVYYNLTHHSLMQCLDFAFVFDHVLAIVRMQNDEKLTKIPATKMSYVTKTVLSYFCLLYFLGFFRVART